MTGDKEKKEKVRIYKQKSKRWMKEKNEIEDLGKSYESIQPADVKTFDEIPLSVNTRKGLADGKFKTPTEIQRESIIFALRGNDILGAAKTGSGKTLAFIIPMLENLYTKKWSSVDGLGALIITPTRELAYQIFEVLRLVGSHHEFSAGLIIGGKDLKFERKRMDKCNIIICTPGRLLQHMDENALLNCDNLQMLVLDEADRILDLGFQATMNSIIENLPQTRQTLLFSATQTKSVKDLARLSLDHPMYVSVHEHSEYSTPQNLDQSYIVAELEDKVNLLWSFVKAHKKSKILVFMSSCKQVKYIFESFCRLQPGISILALYGTLHQMKRMAVYDQFVRKSHAVLFATDIAARGLDFPAVNWVVQLDCPEDAKTYIHRAGRTARYEKNGESLLILLPSEEEGMIKQLNEKKIPIEKIKVNPRKNTSIQKALEMKCARDVNLKESAQRAFVSYLKSVFLMKNKEIFDITKLKTDAYSASLGLAVPPRVRFLQKYLKRLKEKELLNANPSGDKDVDSKTLETSENDNKANFVDNDSECDDDDELFTVKKVHFNDDDLNQADDKSNSDLPLSKKDKPLTKAAIAKKILRKNITSNTKLLFSEDGNAVGEDLKRQNTQVSDSEGEGGIDISKSKAIMEQEDKIDKRIYRERVKKMHREKRLKLKEETRKNKVQESKIETEMSSDDNSVDMDFLPDPDKVYGNNKDTSDENSDAEEAVGDEIADDSNHDKKRRISDEIDVTESVKKRKMKHVKSNLLDTGLKLADDEELALHLLNSR